MRFINGTDFGGQAKPLRSLPGLCSHSFENETVCSGGSQNKNSENRPILRFYKINQGQFFGFELAKPPLSNDS
jgi:hypothetical protein